MRLRRSILWVPGNSWDKIHQALGTEADCIALDLEDLIPLSRPKASEPPGTRPGKSQRRTKGGAINECNP
jgi:hypothetical protein